MGLASSTLRVQALWRSDPAAFRGHPHLSRDPPHHSQASTHATQAPCLRPSSGSGSTSAIAIAPRSSWSRPSKTSPAWTVEDRFRPSAWTSTTETRARNHSVSVTVFDTRCRAPCLRSRSATSCVPTAIAFVHPLEDHRFDRRSDKSQAVGSIPT